MEDNREKEVIIIKKQSQGNGLGTAGFVLSLIGMLLCWIPVANLILWVLGLVFSFIGVFRRGRGLAVTGLVLSCVSAVLHFFLLSLIFGVS